jgi:hypothetical protein
MGANSDWGVGDAPHIDDAVYAHIKQQWSITVPPVEEFGEDNKAPYNMGQHHLFVQRVLTTANRELGTGFIDYVSTLKIHVLMKRLSMGQLPPDVQNAAGEVHRICWMYSPNWIAGINLFDNIREEVIDEPDLPTNPFKNTWHIVIFVNAFYQKGTDFEIDTASYNPADFYAGQLTYL